MNKLRTHAVKKWLLSRFKSKVSDLYIKDQNEDVLKYHNLKQYKLELGELFAKFD